MRVLIKAMAAASFSIFAACSWTPSLEETTGNSQPPIFMQDVVSRVKCEIYDAARYLRTQPAAAWADNWTAKVNLTLTVANTGALTPSVQAIQMLPNAYFSGVSAATAKQLGVSSTPTAVAQKFTFGASATLSEAATRTELIVFSVAFSDLLTNPSATELKDCDKIAGNELRGGLGLRDWVQSAFSPVGNGQLLAGTAPKSIKDPTKLTQTLCTSARYFKQQGITGCSGDVASELASRWEAAKALNDPCVYKALLGEIGAKIVPGTHDAALTKLTDGVKHEITLLHGRDNKPKLSCTDWDKIFATLKLPDNVATAKNQILLGTDNKQGQHIDGYVPIAKSHYTTSIQKYEKVLRGAQTIANLHTALDQLAGIEKIFSNTQYDFAERFVSALTTPPTSTCGPVAPDKPEYFDPASECQTGYDTLIEAALFLINIKSLTESAKELSSYVTSFTPTKPIDSLTHTVMFLVTYSAGIQPQWTLIQVAGPLTQLANMQGVRTHTLVIALGPETENSSNITNQAILSVAR
jgi:hypothetical protein